MEVVWEVYLDMMKLLLVGSMVAATVWVVYVVFAFIVKWVAKLFYDDKK